MHWQAEKNLTEQFQKRGETGHKCNPYDVSEGPIRARRFQPDEVSVHNRSPASLVVCQLRNAEWKKQEKSVIMMIPTLQLKPRLQSMHSLLLIVIRPRKFNYGYPFNNASIPDVPRCFAMNRSVDSINPVPTRSASQQA